MISIRYKNVKPQNAFRILHLRGNHRLDHLVHSDRRTELFHRDTANSAVPRSTSASAHCSRAQHSESGIANTNCRSLRSLVEVTPTTSAQWKSLVAADAAAVIATLPQIRERLGVKVEAMKIAGVDVFMVTPNIIPPENQNRLLVHVHGGGYVFGTGEAGTLEAIEMAGYGHFKVISVNYRMPPDFPFPAGLDDAIAVWKVAITMAKPENMGIVGSSAGGGLTLAMVLRAKQEHLPMPAAIAAGTPWADLSKTGDTYFSNQMLDNILVSYDGALEASALLYANGHDLKDPLISPIYGDMHNFPPTILTTGTRDLFLSNTVRVHRKLRQCGVEAALHVYEGMSHAQFCIDPFAPESKEAFLEIASFFNAHLGK